MKTENWHCTQEEIKTSKKNNKQNPKNKYISKSIYIYIYIKKKKTVIKSHFIKNVFLEISKGGYRGGFLNGILFHMVHALPPSVSGLGLGTRSSSWSADLRVRV